MSIVPPFPDTFHEWNCLQSLLGVNAPRDHGPTDLEHAVVVGLTLKVANGPRWRLDALQKREGLPVSSCLSTFRRENA